MKLANDLPDLQKADNYSPQTEDEVDCNTEVESWIDRSLQELNSRPIPQHGNSSYGKCIPLRPPPLPANQISPAMPLTPCGVTHAMPPTCPPPRDDGTNVIVSTLATALRDLAASNVANTGPNAKMLSRLCTLKDLPSFSGDPME